MINTKTSSWFSKSRVETFSDGVFAIIITILVLEIKVPHIHDSNSINELKNALIILFPKFVSWIISFFMICVIWVNHHRIFESISNITHRIFWLNAFLLMWCAFIPFPTALVGDYSQNALALSVFGIVLSFVGFAFAWLRYIIIKEGILTNKEDLKHFKKATYKTIFFGIILYLIGVIIAWVLPIISLIIYATLPIYFIFFNVNTINNN